MTCPQHDGLRIIKKQIKKFTAMSIILMGLFLLLEAVTSKRVYSQNRNYYKNADDILKEISKRGVHTIIIELYENPTKWDFVLNRVAGGTKPWLEVAVALHPGSDAGSSEMLTLSVGEALENSPENVFKVALKEFQLESICKGPDMDDARYNSFDLAINAVTLRQKQISNITDPELENISRICFQSLEKSKVDISKIYEITSK